MTKEEFIKKLQEELEIEEVELDADTDLKSLDEWDSMAAMVVIAMTDDLFGKTITANDIKVLTSVKSLIELIGEDKFD